MPEDHPPAEEAFADRVAWLVRLVERWHARVETERWPAVPLAELGRDDPRRRSRRSCCALAATCSRRWSG
jgi:hypothetical protein